MEEYNALEELRRPPTADLSPSFPPSPRIFPAHWRVEEIPDGRKARAFHGLAFYLFFGQGGGEGGREEGEERRRAGRGRGGGRKGGREEGWESSNADTAWACSNWMNVFVPVGGGRWEVEEGERIETESRCFVEAVQPWYEIRVTVWEGGREGGREGGQAVKYQETLRIQYKDLVCRTDSVKGWKMYWRGREGGREGGKEERGGREEVPEKSKG
jgi:hypothetical protein